MGKFFKQMEAIYNMEDFLLAVREHTVGTDTLAAYMDRLIQEEDTIENIVRKAASRAREYGHRTRYTEGTIHGHIKFRIEQARKVR